MRALLSKLILPFPIFFLLLLIAFILFQKGRTKGAKFLGSVSLLLLLIVTTPFIPEQLVKNLENRYPVISVEQLDGIGKPINILVLGGGHTNDNRLPATNQLSNAALARLIEGIRLLNQIPGSMLITSGFKGEENVPQAEVLAKAAIMLGVDSKRIKKQTEPKNTWMEATEYKKLFGDSTQLILVTSAVHMPRAMVLFNKAGLNPMAAPTNHLFKKGKKIDSWFWLPASGNLSKTESAIHEYAGLLWYKLGGN